jgi:hypothetical protein
MHDWGKRLRRRRLRIARAICAWFSRLIDDLRLGQQASELARSVAHAAATSGFEAITLDPLGTGMR